MNVNKISHRWFFQSILVLSTLLLSACSPLASAADRPTPELAATLPASTEPIEANGTAENALNATPTPEQAAGPADRSLSDDLEHDLLISNMTALLETGQPEDLAGAVREQGLVIAPYAVGVPERGLTGDPLKLAMQAMFAGAEPQVVRSGRNQPGVIDMVVIGLNQVEVEPAVGEALTVTSPAAVKWSLGEDGVWHLWIIAADLDGLLAGTLQPAEPEASQETESPQVSVPEPNQARDTFSRLPEDAQAALESFNAAMRAEDVPALANLVPENGLVIAPYAVGWPERGLTGDALADTLEVLLEATDPQVVAVDLSTPGKIRLAVTGFNQVEVKPAVGDAIQMSSPASVTLVRRPLTGQGEWKLAEIAIDLDGEFAESIDQPPFEPIEIPASTAPPAYLSDEQARQVIAEFAGWLQAGDVEALAIRVSETGLILAPYAVGLPEQGLNGEELVDTLAAVVVGSEPQVVAYENRRGEQILFAVTGLNPAEVIPAHGEALTISSPAILVLVRGTNDVWNLHAILVAMTCCSAKPSPSRPSSPGNEAPLRPPPAENKIGQMTYSNPNL